MKNQGSSNYIMSYIQQSNMAMENGPFIDIRMVIFHGYVSLPVYQRVTK